MSKPDIDKVEIVEPPVELLTKRSSRFKLGCFTGCAFVILIIVGGFVAIRLFVGPGPQIMRALPSNFPSSIPLYDKDNVERITYITGRYKTRGVAMAAVFPKLILSPILLSPEQYPTGSSTLKKIWQLLAPPATEERDTVQIEWKNIEAEPSFVANYYKTELRKKDFTIQNEINKSKIKQFSFSNEQGVSGELIAKGDEENKPGTDYAILTVNLPKQQ